MHQVVKHAFSLVASTATSSIYALQAPRNNHRQFFFPFTTLFRYESDDIADFSKNPIVAGSKDCFALLTLLAIIYSHEDDVLASSSASSPHVATTNSTIVSLENTYPLRIEP